MSDSNKYCSNCSSLEVDMDAKPCVLCYSYCMWTPIKNEKAEMCKHCGDEGTELNKWPCNKCTVVDSTVGNHWTSKPGEGGGL
jgi:hypothetical protein